MRREGVGVVGPQLGGPQPERLFEEWQRPVHLPGGLVAPARLFMDVRVSGWSAPNLAVINLSVSSKSGNARSIFPAAW